MVEMIIKGVFRRYERWNPVHPTSGAFWGMGIGIGCGVGWGPGFGPEAIGYVGAGCGAGFSVGITFVGFGIGLPANYIYTTPYNVFMATKSGALEIAQSTGLLGMRNVAEDGWGNIRPHIAGFQQNAYRSFPSFCITNPLENGINVSDMTSVIVSSAKPVMNQLERIRSHLFHSHKDVMKPPAKYLFRFLLAMNDCFSSMFFELLSCFTMSLIAAS